MRYNLLIAKIEDIPIIQDGPSVLKGEIKSTDASKTSTKEKEGVVGKVIGGAEKVANETFAKFIGTGQADETIEINCSLVDPSLTKAFLNLLRAKKDSYTFTDKNLGKMQVFIKRYNVTHSDAHLGRTVYSLSFNIQGVEADPSSGFDNIGSVLSQIREKIRSSVNDIIKTAEKYTNAPLTAYDDLLSVFDQGMTSLLLVKAAIKNTKENYLDRARHTKRIAKQTKNIPVYGKDIYESIVSLGDFFIKDGHPRLGATQVLSPSDERGSPEFIKKAEREALYGREVVASAEGVKELTPEKKQKILLNMASFLANLEFFTNGDISTADEFEDLFYDLMKSLDNIDLSLEEKEGFKKKIINFYVESDLAQLIEMEVPLDTSLKEIVYNYYGDIKNYYPIADLNKIKNGLSFTGKVRLISKE